MIIEEIMNRDIHTLGPSNTVKDAIKIMREKKIRHIPIVDEEEKIVGIITAHDLKNILPSTIKDDLNLTTYETTLENIMVKNPLIGHPLDFIEEVALTLYESKISCLPIVSGGRLVGIVTTTDLLYTYIELTGANKPSSKIDIRVTDKPGILSDITEIFKKHHANVLSVLVYPSADCKKNKIVSVRVQVINPLSIIEDLRKEGFDVLWPNLPGVDGP
ncbi:acetoin utilization AcuB family protein [Ureibacillus sinduriensis]|uniref:Acetoin utilization protein AcuB n=1 Tax=Ureibacillus sinduriensis BLB-1 = JCM 15800 TaxID=1384057 RepID=A0A0A3HYI8_9BACL|nr:acetoin utilization AcuB family protein [Ureibacillus sinduriensis]KGR77676.1 acetoin utilization protein AcuB [Ureibacillus sinduriensis BLB-1 = JCM 15800]